MPSGRVLKVTQGVCVCVCECASVCQCEHTPAVPRITLCKCVLLNMLCLCVPRICEIQSSCPSHTHAQSHTQCVYEISMSARQKETGIELFCCVA